MQHRAKDHIRAQPHMAAHDVEQHQVGTAILRAQMAAAHPGPAVARAARLEAEGAGIAHRMHIEGAAGILLAETRDQIGLIGHKIGRAVGKETLDRGRRARDPVPDRRCRWA